MKLTDEMLTAYLDGEARTEIAAAIEADEAALARLAGLVLPMDDVRAGLSPDALGAPSLPAEILQQPKQQWQMPAAIAAAFAAGLMVMNVVKPAPEMNWIDAVASYQALYVNETVAVAVQPDSLTHSLFERVEDEFEVSLENARDLPGLTFVRAQMLGFEGAPLLQLAYRDENGVPFALCLTRVNGRDHDPETSTHFGLAGTSWVQDGVGYLLIGGTDTVLTEQVSAAFVAG